MDRDEFDSLNPIQQEMWLIVARFYCHEHGCLSLALKNTATFEQLQDAECEYVSQVSFGEYRDLLNALQQAALYVVQEESLFD